MTAGDFLVADCSFTYWVKGLGEWMSWRIFSVEQIEKLIQLYHKKEQKTDLNLPLISLNILNENKEIARTYRQTLIECVRFYLEIGSLPELEGREF